MTVRSHLAAIALILACTCAAFADGARYPIAAGAITHVDGHCYLAQMDFGEDGYKERGATSGLRLYEDGKELGPIDHLHANIINQGGGRYSHWTHSSVFFSTSDNSDPLTNGRKYEVASTNPDSTLGTTPEPPPAGELKRYPMPLDKINPEQGFCYILSMDLGENGYREIQGNSHLLVFEDGKQLGPVDNVHDNIRQIGGGRYSHWGRTSLYFSTSDNTDPRTNGRKYEIASDNFDTVPGAGAPPAAPAAATGWEPLTDEQRAALKFYPLPADSMTPELGFCYTAHMDFGEPGDRESSGKSQLRLFENGRELGPGHALHADIREQGAGRFSHWTADGLYFSASDNTDPRTNGRTYTVASTDPDNTLGGLVDLMSKPMTHTEIITGGRHEYTVTLGGNLDMNNTLTRRHGGISITFQPNISLTIANTGATPVVWPKLVANGRDWSTIDALLEDFTRGATNDQEKALFIWEAMRQHRYHQLPLYANDEFHDPVKMFNSYGLQLCDDMGYCGCSLFKHAGLGKPKYELDPTVYSLYGHVQCEAVVDNELQFLDIDQDAFYLDRECERPVSGETVARDHDLVRREVHYGPVFGGFSSSESAAALFGSDDTQSFHAVSGHEMDYTLRPGERVTFRWDNVGKWVAQSAEWDKRPVFWGNSRFVYEPRLAPETYREGVIDATDIVPATAQGASLAGGSADAMLKYAFDIPWAVCGGTVRAEFVGLSAADRFAIDLSLDGETMKRVWEGGGAGPVSAEVTLDEALDVRNAPVKYQHW
ncbi:MAG TPA: hypothetical protein VM283_05580, partial [Armatimonadota bacterium]|nr:hypothetical protein [Armatimonadota bacterium]